LGECFEFLTRELFLEEIFFAEGMGFLVLERKPFSGGKFCWGDTLRERVCGPPGWDHKEVKEGKESKRFFYTGGGEYYLARI